ncbi:Bro-N domain-containing protein [Pseudomonas sp. SH1-B]
MTMQFEKKNFMGIELDVLVGHPEHDLLFIAAQVARAAGLKAGSDHFKRVAEKYPACRAIEALGANLASMRPSGVHAPTWHKMFLFPEGTVYQMLLRGHAPASEPFRKWVTEEVLPSIRKTGKYNAEESSNPIAQGIMDRLMSLEGIILKQGETLEALRQELRDRPPTPLH